VKAEQSPENKKTRVRNKGQRGTKVWQNGKRQNPVKSAVPEASQGAKEWENPSNPRETLRESNNKKRRKRKALSASPV